MINLSKTFIRYTLTFLLCSMYFVLKPADNLLSERQCLNLSIVGEPTPDPATTLYGVGFLVTDEATNRTLSLICKVYKRCVDNFRKDCAIFTNRSLGKEKILDFCTHIIANKYCEYTADNSKEKPIVTSFLYPQSVLISPCGREFLGLGKEQEGHMLHMLRGTVVLVQKGKNIIVRLQPDPEKSTYGLGRFMTVGYDEKDMDTLLGATDKQRRFFTFLARRNHKNSYRCRFLVLLNGKTNGNIEYETKQWNEKVLHMRHALLCEMYPTKVINITVEPSDRFECIMEKPERTFADHEQSATITFNPHTYAFSCSFNLANDTGDKFCLLNCAFFPNSKILQFFPCLQKYMYPSDKKVDGASIGARHIVGYDSNIAELYHLTIPEVSRLSDPLFLQAVHDMVKADNYNTGSVNSYIALAWNDPSAKIDRWKLDGMYRSEGYYVTKTLGIFYQFQCSFHGLHCDSWNETMATFAKMGINVNDKRYTMTDEEYNELHAKICAQHDFAHTLTMIRDYLYVKSERTAQRLEEDYNRVVAKKYWLFGPSGLFFGGVFLFIAYGFLHRHNNSIGKFLH